MELYFLKSAACLAILMLFYKLLLEKENMHVFKRFYLLIAVLVSLGIPFITFTTYVEALPRQTVHIVQTSYEAPAETQEENINYWPLVLWIIYALGILFFSVIFIKNLRNLVLKIRRNPRQESNGIIKVLLEEEVTPHTFWNYIFLNKKKSEEGSIPHEVLEHERAHAMQKHSIDILFMELLQIVFWFYPLIYFVKNAIKLNHEFLADRAVISKGANTTRYQQTLLAFSSNANSSNLVNSINYSSIKKRFTVMKKTTSKRAIWCKGLLVLPLLAILVYSCSTNEIVEEQSSNAPGRALILGDEGEDGVQRPETITVSENINIRLFKNGSLIVNEEETSLKQLPERLSLINAGLTKETRTKMTQADIFIEPEVKMGLLTDVKSALMDYGVSEIKILAILEDRDRQDKATPEMVEKYNKLARDYRSNPQKPEKSRAYDFLRMSHIYSIMTDEQKKNAEPLPDLLPSYQQTKDSTPNKKLTLFIASEEVLVNGQRTSVREIAEVVDKATRNWTTADYNLHGLEIKVTEDVSKEQIDQLNVELKKTNLAKSSTGDSPYISYFINSNSPPAVPGVEKYLTEDSDIYLNGKIISAGKALKLLKAKRDELKISIQQDGENTVITMEDLK